MFDTLLIKLLGMVLSHHLGQHFTVGSVFNIHILSTSLFLGTECSGFLIKCVYGTYAGYISLQYMAIRMKSIKSTKSTHGVSMTYPIEGYI